MRFSALIAACTALFPVSANAVSFISDTSAFSLDRAFNVVYYVTGPAGANSVAAGSSADGFDSAQTSSANGGTAIAVSSGTRNIHGAGAISSYFNTFELPPSVRGRLTYRLSGWANASGSGYAVADWSLVNFATGDVLANGAVNSEGTGFHKASWTRTVAWTGGDNLYFRVRASTSVVGIYGPGFASAYIDPTVTISTVPEPASWALLITGFLLTGLVGRQRRMAI